MKIFWVAVAIFTKIIYVENRTIPWSYLPDREIDDLIAPLPSPVNMAHHNNINMLKRDSDNIYLNTYEIEKKRFNEHKKKPCSIVVLSNAQNPNTRSLLRRYRYDSNGILIPSSVKYFIKLPRGTGSAPVLLPLNDKAFSPLGGFVRYYKEVPPIPQSW